MLFFFFIFEGAQVPIFRHI